MDLALAAAAEGEEEVVVVVEEEEEAVEAKKTHYILRKIYDLSFINFLYEQEVAAVAVAEVS